MPVVCSGYGCGLSLPRHRSSCSMVAMTPIPGGRRAGGIAVDQADTFHFERGARKGSTWQIAHAGLVIWGITANLTRRFYDLVLKDEVPW